MIHVALLGFGVVGSGTAEVLTQNKSIIERKVGQPVSIKYILDLRDFPDSPFADRIVHDFNIIVNDPEVSVVAEMMGGSHPAYDFTLACLKAGKSVVTSNKEVVANFGTELLTIAKENGVSYLFEASVGGGIPIIRPLREDLSSNNVTAISGILNGTTNYILTRMDNEGASFADVLKDAQRLGYAEANPAADVEGLDAARKIAILAAMAFGKRLNPNEILCEGITSVTAADSELAKEMGYAIKLIGYTTRMNGRILAMVSPRLVSRYNPIHGVNDVNNGILVNADMVGQVMFYGPGAGKLPTASAVAGDLIDVMAHTPAGVISPVWVDAEPDQIADPETYVCRHLVVLDAPKSAEAEISAHLDLNAPHFTEGRFSFITEELSEAEVKAKIAEVGYPLITRIRVL
ncbi:MAG: homoserine dehydrogenase [Clostridia bacterium]|nr:homoserine dehydrogenase [Clostridia bacterium]